MAVRGRVSGIEIEWVTVIPMIDRREMEKEGNAEVWGMVVDIGMEG